MSTHHKVNQKSGFDLLNDPSLNKATAFSETEREQYKLRGLLPTRVFDQQTQIMRAMANLRRKHNDIERYIFLQAMHNRNERLFYRLLIENIEYLMPIVYTPTVGQACLEFSQNFRQTQGFYITPQDRGQVREILNNWPRREIRLIVVTDGERILGLGDLGANGMGISIGKLALYSACAGIPPAQCLPVMLDVGTNNKTLREDPMYLGLNRPRITGEAYHSLVDEFVMAVQDAFPFALIQFEDFLTPNAYTLLNTWKDRVLCFNDDIQGTAAVALAGILAAIRITGTEFCNLRIMFLGAGSAATGIADLIRVALCKAGLSDEESCRRLWFVDQFGLVIKARDNLALHNLPYAHDVPDASFLTAMKEIKPHVLIGATGAPSTFTEKAVRLMAEINPMPIIFALSNPTSRAECTAEEAYQWSNGQAIFASGSPFGTVNYEDKIFHPGQGNNAYVFPGIGLGAIACCASNISEDMLLAAAYELAAMVSEKDMATGAIYPPLSNIRQISIKIAAAVARQAWKQGFGRIPELDDIEQNIIDFMYNPSY